MTDTRNAQSDGPFIRWYGERGVVNALVNHLSREPVNRVRALLGAVKWADGSRPEWLAGIVQVTAVVELGLADFGDPDLILVCELADRERHCVFIEAKVIPYSFSMKPNNHHGPDDEKEQRGMEISGFNSSINGQLSLKYRFAKALAAYPPSDGEFVQEPHKLADAYGGPGGTQEYRRNGRCLKKRQIIEQILRPLGLLGLPEQNCCYVAMTWDDVAHAFFSDKGVGDGDGMPVFLDERGNDVYLRMKPRVGWLGYGQLESPDALPALTGDKEYRGALLSMVPDSNPTNADYERLASQKMSSLDSKTLAAAGGMADSFRAVPGLLVEQLAGSFSIKRGNETVAKVMPGKQGIYIGVRTDVLEAVSTIDETDLRIRNINGREFRGVYLTVTAPQDARVQKLVDALR